MKSTAWLYAVVSSDQQAETLDAQRAWGTKTAVENGWRIVREFSGVSTGKGGVRQLLTDLLAELRATPKGDRPARILLVRIDRLGRGDSLDVMGALAEIRRLGVTLHTREDGDLRIERASDAVLPAIKAIVAAIENETRTDRVRAGIARRRAAGKHVGAVPYGTVLLDGKPVPFEPEAAIVREIFELIAKGWGLERIAGAIRPKAPPKRLPNGRERSMTWGQSTVRSIYLSEVVRALVVDAELLRRATAARASNYRYRPTGEWEWPLRGAVRCTCGHVLMGHATGVAPYRIRYYRCRSHPYDQRGPGNTKPGHRADDLEASFLDLLKRLPAEPHLIAPPMSPNELNALEAKRTALRTQLSKLDGRRRRACELAEDGAYSSADLRERLDRIEGDRKRVTVDLERVQLAIDDAGAEAVALLRVRDELQTFPKRWKRAAIDRRQAFARAVATLLGGLYADPEQRGVILPGRHVQRARKATDNRSLETRKRMFHDEQFATSALAKALATLN